MAQHHHQRVPPPPRQRERPEVHLALTARRRLEPHRRLDRLPRPHLAHVVPHAAVAARIPRRANLVEQALRRQLRELPETRLDDPLVRVQPLRPARPRRVPRPPRGQVPVQLARLDPLVDRPPAHPEPPRQLRLRHPLFQIVFSRILFSHPCIRVPPRPCWIAQQDGRLGFAPQTTMCAVFGCHKWEFTVATNRGGVAGHERAPCRRQRMAAHSGPRAYESREIVRHIVVIAMRHVHLRR